MQSPYSLKRGYRPLLTRQLQTQRINSTISKPKLNLSNSIQNTIQVNLPNKFDLDRAIELMQLSIFAYEQFNYFNTQGNGSVDGWSPKSPNASYSVTRTLYTYEKKDKVAKKIPIGFIAKKDNVSSVPDFYICWRGTITGPEWVSDLDFQKTTCSFLKNGEKVHEGFQNVYTGGDDELGDSPRKVVLDYLELIKEETPDYNLWITGHSLGGGLAVLNICDIVVNTSNKNAKMYNFAGPRVGNSAFATTFEKYIGTNCCNTNSLNNCCSWRVVNTNDEVPNAPPTSIGFIKSDYVHVNGCSGVSVCNNANSNDNSLNGLFEITFPSDKNINIIAAHSAATYLSTLKNLRTI